MRVKFITLAMLVTNFCFGQYQQFEQFIAPYLSGPVQSGFFRFQTPNNFQVGQLYSLYKNITPDFDNDMRLLEHSVDSQAGYHHYKYQQLYKNIPVEGAGCIEHFDTNGSLRLINAKIADSINQDHVPKITGEQAINTLIDRKKKENEKIVFAWEDNDLENQLIEEMEDPNATWYPVAELIWAIDSLYDVQLVIPGSRYTLAYQISLTTLFPKFETIIYYVNANNGEVLKERKTDVYFELSKKNNNLEEAVQIFPNPANSHLTVKLPQETESPIKIFDMNGKLVLEFESDELYFQQDVSSLNDGIYLLHIIVNGEQIVKRVSLHK